MTRSYDKQKRAVQIMDVNEKPEDYRNSDLILIRTPDGFIRMTKRPTVERVFQTVPKPLVSPANIYLRGAVPSQIMVAGTEVRNNAGFKQPLPHGNTIHLHTMNYSNRGEANRFTSPSQCHNHWQKGLMK